MKELKKDEANVVGGGRDAPIYEAQLAPEPPSTEPVVVIDYNPPQQPQ